MVEKSCEGNRSRLAGGSIINTVTTRPDNGHSRHSRLGMHARERTYNCPVVNPGRQLLTETGGLEDGRSTVDGIARYVNLVIAGRIRRLILY